MRDEIEVIGLAMEKNADPADIDYLAVESLVERMPECRSRLYEEDGARGRRRRFP
jgi:hypothetical protein